MATFTLGLAVGRVLSRTQIFHDQAKERLRILNRDVRTVVSNFFCLAIAQIEIVSISKIRHFVTFLRFLW